MESTDRVVAPVPHRIRVGLGAAVVLVLLGLAVAVLVATFGGGGSTRSVTLPPSSAPLELASPSASVAPSLYVHILGAVERPGLYQLRSGDRAVDAVAAAGGFTADADQSQLNLARLITDGEQIYLPRIGEAPVVAPTGATAGGGSGAGALPGGKVNLNTADAAALDTLPGVGPATAQRILQWRQENGRFTSIEDLMSVSGIGEKTFAELESLVTV